MRRAASLTRVLDRSLTRCIQIVTFLPAAINFLPDAMVFASNYVAVSHA